MQGIRIRAQLQQQLDHVVGTRDHRSVQQRGSGRIPLLEQLGLSGKRPGDPLGVAARNSGLNRMLSSGGWSISGCYFRPKKLGHMSVAAVEGDGDQGFAGWCDPSRISAMVDEDAGGC